MNGTSLHLFLHFLVDVLGSISLLALMAGGVLWILGKIWKVLLTAGAIVALVVISAFALGVL